MVAELADEEIQQPKVSIVLPLYNSAGELPLMLSELDKQTYQNRELIVVDDGSSDETWEIASRLSSGRSYVAAIRTKHLGASHARNAGASRAGGEIVFFAESDCVYDEHFVQKAVDCLGSQPGAGAVCLTGAPLITRATLATRCIDVENKVQHKLLSEGKIEPFYAWVYRKKVFSSLGGFDERLFQGEDKDLFSRLKGAGYSVAWVPGVNWRHRRDQTTFQMAQKWITRGRSRILYAFKHRQASDIAKALLPFWVTVVGLLALIWFPLLGAVLLLAVAVAFAVQSARIAAISWSEVDKKSVFLGYPAFVVARNFSMAIGYSVALVKVAERKIQKRETNWSNV
jgi:glycosyltransferase involved in cell wall biosynthesis